MRTPIEKAVAAIGSQSALARAVGVTPQAVQLWVKSGQVSFKRVVDVERASGVSRAELRPDIFEVKKKSTRRK